jgi:hypothetical protein
VDDDSRFESFGTEDTPSTDAVLSESVERVRSSRRLIDQIDERLQRGNQLLRGDADDQSGSVK